MTAKEYLTEKARMTNKCSGLCSACKLSPINSHIGCDCYSLEHNQPDQAIAIVEKWSKAHPRKTYKDDFLEKFPKAIFLSNMETCVCRNTIYGLAEGKCKRRYEGCCDCWNEPMEVNK